MDNADGQTFGDNLLNEQEAGYVSSLSPRSSPHATDGSEVNGMIASIGGYVTVIDIGAATVLGAAIMQDCSHCSWHYTYAIVASVVSLVFSIAHSLMKQKVRVGNPLPPNQICPYPLLLQFLILFIHQI